MERLGHKKIKKGGQRAALPHAREKVDPGRQDAIDRRTRARIGEQHTNHIAKRFWDTGEPHDTKEEFTVHSIIRLREVRKNEAGKVSTTLQQGLGSLDGDDDFANLPPHQKALLLFVNDGSHTRVEDVRQRFSKEPVNGVEKRDGAIVSDGLTQQRYSSGPLAIPKFGVWAKTGAPNATHLLNSFFLATPLHHKPGDRP